MKIKVVIEEKEFIEKDTWHERPIFKGELDCVQFRTEDKTIAQPAFVSIFGDSISIIYPQNSNVRIEVEVDEEINHVTGWAKPIFVDLLKDKAVW